MQTFKNFLCSPREEFLIYLFNIPTFPFDYEFKRTRSTRIHAELLFDEPIQTHLWGPAVNSLIFKHLKLLVIKDRFRFVLTSQLKINDNN